MLVALDGDDRDAELADHEAQPQPDLAQADDDDVIAARHHAPADDRDEPPVHEPVDEAGREDRGERERGEHRRCREEPSATAARDRPPSWARR